VPDAAQSAQPGLPVERLHEAGLQVSVYGFFNPRIFHPSWFLAQGLLSEEAAEEAQHGEHEMVAHRMVARWTTRAIELQVTLEELQVTTQDQTQEQRVRDLVRDVLTALPHTPVTGLRVSRHIHLSAGPAASPAPAADGDASGEPVEAVEVSSGARKALSAMISGEASALLPDPLLENLELSSATGPGPGNEALARIGPSYTYPDAFFLSCDDIISLSRGAEPATAADAASRLAGAWDEAAERAHGLFATLAERLTSG
jgi:hypothetical protein